MARNARSDSKELTGSPEGYLGSFPRYTTFYYGTYLPVAEATVQATKQTADSG